MTLISCKDASFSYEGSTVVSRLSFEVNSGDYLCVVGENGSGKSTLLKGLLRLKHPSGGSVSLFTNANETGYLPQQTAAQKNFPASAYEVVLSGRLGMRGIRPFYSKTDRAAALENLSRLGIGSLREKCFRELSVGQRQRVLLARALCSAQRLLFLDEPAAGLDPVAAQELYRLISNLNRDAGIAVVMVSHDIHCAVNNASHILHLRNEQIFFGTAKDYATSNIGAGFLGGEEHARSSN